MIISKEFNNMIDQYHQVRIEALVLEPYISFVRISTILSVLSFWDDIFGMNKIAIIREGIKSVIKKNSNYRRALKYFIKYYHTELSSIFVTLLYFLKSNKN